MEQELPTGRKKRWEVMASASCLLTLLFLCLLPEDAFLGILISIFAVFGIGFAISAIRQRCDQRVIAWILLMLNALSLFLLVDILRLYVPSRLVILHYWQRALGF